MNERPAWFDRARCAGMDPNFFVLERGDDPKPAKKVCNGTTKHDVCPVKDECDAYASFHGLGGVYGGRVHRVNQKKVIVVESVQDATAHVASAEDPPRRGRERT